MIDASWFNNAHHENTWFGCWFRWKEGMTTYKSTSHPSHIKIDPCWFMAVSFQMTWTRLMRCLQNQLSHLNLNSNPQVACYFKACMWNEWESCSYGITPLFYLGQLQNKLWTLITFACDIQMTCSLRHWNPPELACWKQQKRENKVETPYHDNDLIMNPILSSQSGWQWTWSCLEVHMGGFRDGGWQF